MQYTIVRADGFAGLIDQVNQMISQGWQPKGGVAIDAHHGFFQAMIHRGYLAAPLDAIST